MHFSLMFYVLYSEYDKSATVESDLPAVICVITGNNISSAAST